MSNSYITPEAIKWSLGNMHNLPKDQIALFFFLILSKIPRVQRGTLNEPSAFEHEFYRYLGGVIPGDGWAVYNPLEREWRAGEYINSTVYGRLLNGSHRWTSEENGFFKRSPASGWPANFELTDKGFDNLRKRLSPPCLKSAYRLPLTSLAIYYYRFENVGYFSPKSACDLVQQFKLEVISRFERLSELFVDGPQYLRGDLLRTLPLSVQEKVDCYPSSPFGAEPKSRAFLYQDDIEAISSRLEAGQDLADYIRGMLRSEGIWK